MDVVGGFMGLGILIAVVWYLAIFGEVDHSDEQKSIAHRISKKH